MRLRDIKQKKPRSETIDFFSKKYLRIGRLLIDLRLLNVLALLFFCFIQGKHLIPFVNSELWDAFFIEWERRIFGNQLATGHLITLLGTSSATRLSDAYVFFYPYMGLVLMVVVVTRNLEQTLRFVTAFCLLWMLGLLMVYLMPTLGPCFSVPQVVSALPNTTEVAQMQRELWRMRSYVLLHPESPQGVHLISGLPSLHVATVVLGSLFLSHYSRVLSALSWFFAVVTCITTLYFGWHFVVDNVLAIVLAFGLYRVFQR